MNIENLSIGRKLVAVGTILVAWCACFPGYGQNSGFRFESLPGKGHLATRFVYAIIQDARGFIWTGTREGLTRYDGYSQVVYRHETDNSYSLSDNVIHALCIDNEGTLWIGTDNGLNRYDVKNDRFETFFHDSADNNSLSHNSILALAKDPAGRLWIGTYGGGLDIMFKTKNGYQFNHHKHNDRDNSSISNNQILSLCFDKYERAWVGTSDGLNILRKGAKNFIRFYHRSEDKNSIHDGFIYRMFADKDGAVWICGKGMLDHITWHSDLLQDSISVHHFLPAIIGNENPDDWVINNFLKDRHGNKWIATNDRGLIKFNITNDGKIAFEWFENNPQMPYSLASSTVHSLFEDRSGVIWIGTAMGVSKYIPSKAAFAEANFFSKTLPTYKSVVIALLSDKNNRLWLADDSDSLQVISRKRNGTSLIQKISMAAEAGISGQINVLYQSNAGNIYIGTLYQGLFIIPKSLQGIYDKKNWVHITVKQDAALLSNNIYSIAEDGTGTILIGTYKGLCTYNPATSQIRSSYAFPYGTIVPEYIIRSICVDEKGVAWCGTDNGVYLLKEGTIIKSFKNIKNNSASLSHNSVRTCYIDHNKNIWIGTREGLNLYNPIHDNFQRFLIKDGLPHDGIRSLLEDAKGNLWIATNHGLVKYNLQRKKIYTYSIDDGLSSDEFITNAVCSDHAGIFYFGTNNGLVSFTPENITPNEYIPPVVITNINIFNKPLFSLDDTTLINTYKKENKLVLHYNQNFFSFEFAALNFINSAANHYTYTLEGVDRQWNDCGTQRLAGYTDIAPGHYVFKVKGANNDGIWNNTPATLDVIITPPWWKTWWFYTLCSIAACAVISLIYRIRLQQILKVYKLRSNIAKDLHDDVGSALSSIALLSSIAQDEKASARLKPQEIFSRISDTSKRMIDNMNDIVWTVNPANDRFGNMLIRMKACAVEMFEAKNIAFTIKISEGLDDLKIPMQIRKDYFLVFKEAVNNLVKYSLCSNAAIVIDRINHALITTIDDDGKGFDREIICSGNGLKNMQERADNMNGKLHIVTEPGKGTSITLIVPVT